MKYVLLAIFVLFAAQPFQASACDMCDGQNTSNSQHGDMHDGPMSGDNEQDMDCCDPSPADTKSGCDSMSHCGACTAGAVAMDASVDSAIFGHSSRQYTAGTGELLSKFYSPPFRPPIS